MFKFHRYALVGALLALGAAGCGDDEVTPVPTPDPLAAVFVPQSQAVAVGAVAQYALNISGGEGTADWVCGASPAPATATKTATGCSASSTAGGSFLVTATVTKGSESIPVAASLTVTATQQTPATVTISQVNQGTWALAPAGASVVGTPANVLLAGGQLDVVLNIERGTEVLTRVDLLVGTTVVASQTLSAGAVSVEEGPDGQAIQLITLSFNSACYTSGAAGAACGTVDATAGTSTVRHPNGNQAISAQLAVSGGATSLRSSNTVNYVFANVSGVHAIVTLPTTSAISAATGLIYFGGPTGGGTTITAVPVNFGSGTVTQISTTLPGCGAAVTDTTAPFTATFACAGFESAPAGITPAFTGVAGGNPFGPGGVPPIINLTSTPFPVRLDFLGPGTPLFAANPNGRQNGWINAAVGRTGANTSATDNDWLVMGAPDAGVGGNTARIRWDITAPTTVAAARASAPNANLPAPTVNNNDVCFIASSVDDLGNESALPAAATSCLTPPFDPFLTGANVAAVSTHLRGGVDTAIPTIAFVDGANLLANARINTPTVAAQFQVTVADLGAVGNSGMLAGSPVLARLETRTILTTTCGGAGLPGATVSGVCTSNATGLTVGLPLVTTSGVAALTTPAFFTLNARGIDAAGNFTADISRVVARDNLPAVGTVPAIPATITGPFLAQAFLSDDLSIRDYYWNVGFSGVIFAGGDPTTIRLAAAPTVVDAYNAATLNHTNFLTSTSISPFLGLQSATAGSPDAYAAGAFPLSSVDIFVRDQTQAAYSSPAAAAAAPTAPAAGIAITNAAPAWTFTAYAVTTTNAIVCVNPSCGAVPTSTTLSAVMTGTTATLPNPFSRVDFYAVNATTTDLVLIGSVAASSVSLVDNGATRVFTAALPVTAAAFFATIEGLAGTDETVNVYAFGVNAAGTIAMVSDPVAQTVDATP